jgi:hypothetical protein
MAEDQKADRGEAKKQNATHGYLSCCAARKKPIARRAAGKLAGMVAEGPIAE